jgi:4-oxalocrotonate tautomerase family enzyme
MPLVVITMRTGRTDDQISSLVSEVTDAVVNTVSVTPDRVRVLVHELEASRIAVGGVTAAATSQT